MAKRDAADILQEEGPDALRAAFDQDVAAQKKHEGVNGAKRKPKPLRFANIAGWEGKPDPERDWVVDNRVPANNVTLLSGHGAIGKTTCACQLTVGVIRGSDWLGAVIRKPGRVLFMTAEETEDDLRARLRPILAQHNLSWRDIASSFYAFCCATEDATLGRPDRNRIIRPTPLFASLEEAVLDIKPRLIVLEALTDIFAGKENERREVNEFVKLYLHRLAIKTSGAVLVLGHTSAAGLATGSGDSGSTQWHNAVRSRMYLHTAKASDDSEPDQKLRQLEFKKNTWGPLDPPVRLRWVNGLFVPETNGSSLDKLARDNKAEETFLRLLRRFIDQKQHLGPNKGPTYAPAKFARHEQADGITSPEFDRAMQRLIDAGKVHIRETGPESKRRSLLVLGSRPPELV